MKFFESDVVAASIEEIVEMQQEVLIYSQFIEYATLEQQRDNLDLLRRLQVKQKNMCFRCLLSDDPDAKHMFNEVMSHFAEYGHVIDPENPMKVFDEVEEQLDEMEEDIEYCEKYGYFPGEDPGGENPPQFM